MKAAMSLLSRKSKDQRDWQLQWYCSYFQSPLTDSLSLSWNDQRSNLTTTEYSSASLDRERVLYDNRRRDARERRQATWQVFLHHPESRPRRSRWPWLARCQWDSEARRRRTSKISYRNRSENRPHLQRLDQDHQLSFSEHLGPLWVRPGSAELRLAPSRSRSRAQWPSRRRRRGGAASEPMISIKAELRALSSNLENCFIYIDY